MDKNSDFKLELEGFPDDVSIPEIKFDITNIFGNEPKENSVEKAVPEQELKKNEIVVEKPVVTHAATAVAEPIIHPVVEPVAKPVTTPVIEPETKVDTENFPQATEIQQPIAELSKVARNGKQKKVAMMGAGIAVTLGMAYAIAKALKGKK
jgi:hypothetical protein